MIGRFFSINMYIFFGLRFFLVFKGFSNLEGINVFSFYILIWYFNIVICVVYVYVNG